MRILHVSGAKSWGGNEQQLIYLMEGLMGKGISQYLLCHSGTLLYQKAKDLNIELIEIPGKKVYNLKSLSGFAATVRKFKIEIIHLHTSNSLTAYVLSDFFYKLNIPTLFSKKAISTKNSVLSKFKYNYRGINRMLCVSEYVKENFKKQLKPGMHYKLHVVPDGVPIETLEEPQFHLKTKFNIPENYAVIGNIANHTRAKDLGTLIESLNYLVNEKKYKEVFLVQIGKFSGLTKDFQEMVIKYHLEDHIGFLGFTENANRFHKEFDVYLMTSRREGGPTSVLEAFSLGTPVVTTKVGIMEEAIMPGKSGFLAPVGDYKELANHLIVLLDDKELRKQISINAYIRFKNNYTVTHFITRTFKHYEAILAKA